MQFPYTKYETKNGLSGYRPHVPLVLRSKRKVFRARALIDTGADFPIFPSAVANFLEIELDDSKKIVINHAGSGTFVAYPSREKIALSIEVKKFRPIKWESTIYFADGELAMLLGIKDCLEKFDITFFGPEKNFNIMPRFKF